MTVPTEYPLNRKARARPGKPGSESSAASVAWLTARRLVGEEQRLVPLACGLTVALSGPLVWSAAGAMEVPLFVAMILASCRWAQGLLEDGKCGA